MASGVKPRVKVPKKAAAGDVITIKTLISHKMESGQRKDKEGNVIPRSIINRFTCDFNGENVLDIKLACNLNQPFLRIRSKGARSR